MKTFIYSSLFLILTVAALITPLASGQETASAEYYRHSAESGNAFAQFNLGFCYANGLGVSKNEAEAVSWYRKAAAQGYTAAQSNLGFCYGNGTGVAKDQVEAAKWYRKAAEQGYAVAQSNLGFCYWSGDGVVKNEAEAVSWYRKAAEQGHAAAQSSLGLCYGNGTGVAKDDVEGYKWLLLAGAQGFDAAKANIRFFESRLSTTQRLEGQRLAKEWEVNRTNSIAADQAKKITEQKASATPSFPTEAPESSFEKKLIHGGATIELPKSWAAVTDFNHNLDESMEAGLSGVDLRKFNINPSQNKTQLIAVGKFGESKTSVAIIYIDCKTYTQEQLASSSANEKTQVTSFLENQMKTIFDSHTKVSIDRVGPYEAIVARWEKISENMTMSFYQLPLGSKIVQIQFICESKLEKIWEPIWIKIVKSYVP
jgi:TPR repeat protein